MNEIIFKRKRIECKDGEPLFIALVQDHRATLSTVHFRFQSENQCKKYQLQEIRQFSS